jgi:anaerobic magnesium-protoporphyrin IX monomethyl ester cyclase
MPQVILIDPGYENSDDLVNKFNMGIVSIASFLKFNGIDTVCFQKKSDYDRELFNFLEKGEVVLIGISMMTIQYSEGELLARKIKEFFPEIKIVAGGYHVKIYPEKTLSNTSFDIAVTGDGEQTMLEIYDACVHQKPLSAIDGIGFKDENGLHWTEPAERFDLNRLPQINYSVIYNLKPNTWYDSQKSMYVYSGTGCGNRCTFCINSVFNVKRRLRPIDLVVNEIEHLVNTQNISHIYIIDENFGSEKSRFLSFLDLCETRNLNFDFFFQTRADIIADGFLKGDVLKRIKRIGCRYILVGIESGSDRMRKIMNKKLSLHQIYRSLQMILEAGITPWITLMIGMPDENLDDYHATFRLMWEIKKIGNRYPQGIVMDIPALYRPIPGSLMYERAKSYYKNGYEIDFSEKDHFLNSDLPTSLQVQNCNYLWIQNPKQLYTILSCMERYVKFYSGMRGFLKKFMESLLFWFPGRQKKLLTLKINPEFSNPLLFFYFRLMLYKTNKLIPERNRG